MAGRLGEEISVLGRDQQAESNALLGCECAVEDNAG